jgi:hypothetical protein
MGGQRKRVAGRPDHARIASILIVSDAVNDLLDGALSEEAQAIVVLCNVIATRIAKTAPDHASGLSGVEIASGLIAQRVSLLVQGKL